MPLSLLVVGGFWETVSSFVVEVGEGFWVHVMDYAGVAGLNSRLNVLIDKWFLAI